MRVRYKVNILLLLAFIGVSISTCHATDKLIEDRAIRDETNKKYCISLFEDKVNAHLIPLEEKLKTERLTLNRFEKSLKDPKFQASHAKLNEAYAKQSNILETIEKDYLATRNQLIEEFCIACQDPEVNLEKECKISPVSAHNHQCEKIFHGRGRGR